MPSQLTLGLCAVLVVVLAVGSYMKRRLCQLETREMYREEFFSYAKWVVARGDVPDAAVKLLLFLGRQLDAPTAPYALLLALLRGAALAPQTHADSRRTWLDAEMRRCPQDVREAFGNAVASGLMAIAANSVVLGTVIRRVILFRVRKRDGEGYDGTEDANIIATGWANPA